MFLHDTIKIKLSESGYLPNYPYHLISDSEMCDAFIDTSWCELQEDSDGNYVLNPIGDRQTDNKLFDDYYGFSSDDSELNDAYQNLINSICYYILLLKIQNIQQLPDWIYSYMLRMTISNESESIDIEDLCRIAKLPVQDAFSNRLYHICLANSINQLQRSDRLSLRAPTIFGEPHVIKELRTHTTD